MFYKNLIVNVFFSLSESIFQSFHFLFRTTLSILITSMSLLLKAIQDCIKKYQQTERVCGYETKHKSYSRFSTSVQSCSVVLPHQQSSLTPLTTCKSASLRLGVDTVEEIGFLFYIPECYNHTLHCGVKRHATGLSAFFKKKKKGNRDYQSQIVKLYLPAFQLNIINYHLCLY